MIWAEGQPVTPPEDIPDYWASVDGKDGDDLFNALSSATCYNFSQLSYDGLYDAYAKTDVYPTDSGSIAGQIWDMYAECTEWKKGKCGTYDVPCDCYNREHSIPQSYWGGGTGGIGSDAFHVVPTDGKINGVRNNYEYGMVGAIDTKTDYSNYNGNKLGSATSWSTDKATIATTAGETVTGSGKVFEPNNQYKGDLARGIMGAIVKWKRDVTTSNDFFDYPYNATHYYGLSKKAVVLLMKWHREDPVSRKEVDRNNGIQATQGNRNPFIDYPYLAEYIWGEHAGEELDLSLLLPSCDPAFELGVSDGQRTSIGPIIPKPEYDVKWMVNKAEYLINKATENKSAVLPDQPADCSEDQVFMGWTANKDFNGDLEEIFTLKTPIITCDTTFYAVFAHKEGNGVATPVKAESIAVGDQVIFVCETAKKEMTAINASKYGEGTAYTDQPAATFVFEVVAGTEEGSFAFKNGDNYLFGTSGNSLNIDAELTANTSWKVTIASGNATITNCQVTDRVLLWNKQATRFACYAGKSVGKDYYAVQLYRIVGGATYSDYKLLCDADTPTSIDQTAQKAVVVEKILIDGHLFIRLDGKVYTLQGIRVQ
jgi:endonuclease I